MNLVDNIKFLVNGCTIRMAGRKIRFSIQNVKKKKKTLKHVDDVTDKSKSLKYRAA